MLAHVGSMLAHVGPSGLQDDPTWLQAGPSWPQDAIMLAKVGLKISKMVSNSQLGSIFLPELAYSGTPQTINIFKQTTMCFIGPFASCVFVFVNVFWASKSVQVGSKLAQVG